MLKIFSRFEHVDWERDKHALHSEHEYEASGNDSRSFFADNIFADSNKNTKSAKIFTRENFPLYSIRYTFKVTTASIDLYRYDVMGGKGEL